MLLFGLCVTCKNQCVSRTGVVLDNLVYFTTGLVTKQLKSQNTVKSNAGN